MSNEDRRLIIRLCRKSGVCNPEAYKVVDELNAMDEENRNQILNLFKTGGVDVSDLASINDKG